MMRNFKKLLGITVIATSLVHFSYGFVYEGTPPTKIEVVSKAWCLPAAGKVQISDGPMVPAFAIASDEILISVIDVTQPKGTYDANLKGWLSGKTGTTFTYASNNPIELNLATLRMFDFGSLGIGNFTNTVFFACKLKSPLQGVLPFSVANNATLQEAKANGINVGSVSSSATINNADNSTERELHFGSFTLTNEYPGDKFIAGVPSNVTYAAYCQLPGGLKGDEGSPFVIPGSGNDLAHRVLGVVIGKKSDDDKVTFALSLAYIIENLQ